MERTTPISYDILFRGMQDKFQDSDDSGQHVRSIKNFITNGQDASPRPGLNKVRDLGKPVIDLYVDEGYGSDYDKIYIFTADELFYIEHNAGGYSTPLSIGSYATTDRITAGKFTIRGTQLYTSVGAVTTDSAYVEDASGAMPIKDYINKLLRLFSVGVEEYMTIITNTDSIAYTADTVDVAIRSYANPSFTIYNKEDAIIFTAGGNLYSTDGNSVKDTYQDFEAIHIHGGRVFATKEDTNRVFFSNIDALHFPENNYLLFDDGDGDVLGFETYIDSTVIMFQHAIYTLRGTSPETFVLDRRFAENVNIRSHKSWAVKNNTMYFLSDRGLEALSRPNLRDKPEVRTLSYFLDDSRFTNANKDSVSAMTIIGNRIIVQMGTYILVHDANMSELIGSAWFGEYEGFRFVAGAELDGKTYLACLNGVYIFDDTLLSDEDHADIVCEVEGSAVEYAQRDMRKLYRDVVFYQTWNAPGGEMEFTSSGRDIPEETETRTDVDDGLTDEEQFYCTMESPYLNWKLKMKGDFHLEDIIFSLLPSRKLNAKSHIA